MLDVASGIDQGYGTSATSVVPPICTGLRGKQDTGCDPHRPVATSGGGPTPVTRASARTTTLSWSCSTAQSGSS